MKSRVGRTLLFLVCDLVLVALASVIALLLRQNLVPTIEQTMAFLPYLAASLASALVVLGAIAVTFSYNRMDQIARSLPILQGLLVCCALIGARVLSRLHHARRQQQRTSAKPFRLATDPQASHVLLVGVGRLAEAYLQAVSDIAHGRVKIVGLLLEKPHQLGRLLRSVPVMGTPDNIDHVVRDLGLHGVEIDRIIIAMPFDALSADAQAELLRLERESTIRLQFVGQDLGLEPISDSSVAAPWVATEARPDGEQPVQKSKFVLVDHDIAIIAQRPYWRLKRAMDVIGAVVLICLFIPLFPIVALVTALSVGLPVVFWQQRPGLGGQPFRLFKFRTMLAAHDVYGRRIPDSQRQTRVGAFLRRTRLDELPQLFSILTGYMSFIGPRSLLPVDQSDSFRARLLVRPGLTGWAQVVGGRMINAEDEAALDVWYVKNASLWLDTRIFLMTIPMVLFGERTSVDLIRRSWKDFIEAGNLDNELADLVRKRLGTAA